MTERKGQTLGDVLARIREGAKGMRGKPYTPEPEAMPLPPPDAPLPPQPHHEPGEDDHEA